MKRILAIVGLMALLAVPKLWAKDDEVKVVLIGNSITELWPQRGASLFKEHPEIKAKGVSGETSTQIRERFQKDVVELNPEIVVINCGTNDIALNGGPYDEDTTFGNVKAMAETARENGIIPVLASCLPAEGFKWRPEVKDAMKKIRSLNARIKDYAEEEGLVYIDYFNAMVSSDGSRMNPRLSDEPKAVHPNARGYALMKKLLLGEIKKLRD